MPSNFANPVDVFRSARRRACDERAFVLTAVGIESEIELDGDAYAVRVDATVSAHALHHLWQYEEERRSVRLPEPVMELRPNAWQGSLLFAIVILLVPLAVAQGWSQSDLYAVGVMDPPLIRAGQWWRAWTALTLHGDATHLLGNLGAGVLLGYSAAQIWGNARAWAMIVTAAACANLLEAVTAGKAGYVSLGASTVLFAALGLVAAWTWRTRRNFAHNSMRRWAPLIAGIAVLALFGGGGGDPQAAANPLAVDPLVTGNNHTNVLSHALGFITGSLAGIAAATKRGARLLSITPAWVAAAVATGPLLLAWSMALLAR